MSETPEQQRERILKRQGVKAAEYDLAVALGYQPESWDGMWKLPPNPFTFRNGCVIVREIVYKPGTHDSIWTDDNREVTRLKAHPRPKGWPWARS